MSDATPDETRSVPPRSAETPSARVDAYPGGATGPEIGAQRVDPSGDDRDARCAHAGGSCEHRFPDMGTVRDDQSTCRHCGVSWLAWQATLGAQRAGADIDRLRAWGEALDDWGVTDALICRDVAGRCGGEECDGGEIARIRREAGL